MIQIHTTLTSKRDKMQWDMFLRNTLFSPANNIFFLNNFDFKNDLTNYFEIMHKAL